MSAEPQRAPESVTDRSPPSTPDSSDADRRRGGGLLWALGRGIVGGVVATVTMTVYRFPIFRALPPTADFWAKFVGGGEPADYYWEGLVLHVGYGAGAGGVCGAMFSRYVTRDPDRRAFRGVVFGTAFGLVLSVFGERVLLGRLLDVDLRPNERLIFHVGHLVYGLTLGTWIGTHGGLGETRGRQRREDRIR